MVALSQIIIQWNICHLYFRKHFALVMGLKKNMTLLDFVQYAYILEYTALFNKYVY